MSAVSEGDQKMANPRSVCVYCGSNVGKDPAFLDAACRMGQTLASQKVDLIYGGGALGLMGASAQAALDAGGRVVGIIPHFLKEIEVQFENVTELIVTETMHERKQIMFERSDAFVALPGGIGTLEETVEVLTWAQLQRHKKPIVLVNIHDYWSPLLELFDHMVKNGFVKEEAKNLWIEVPGVEAVLPAIESRLSQADLDSKSAVDSVI